LGDSQSACRYDAGMLVRTHSSDSLNPLPPTTPFGPDWVHEIKHDGYRLMGAAIRSASACSFATV
jgi:ATP-dependent DNA ligase